MADMEGGLLDAHVQICDGMFDPKLQLWDLFFRKEMKNTHQSHPHKRANRPTTWMSLTTVHWAISQLRRD